VTAVGDNKQQIMRWAMAMDDAFSPFEAEFSAKRTPLLNNYRSSPDLVRIQDILAKAIDAKAASAVSKSEGTIVGHSCEVWDFQTANAEAKCLAGFCRGRGWQSTNSTPRDFAVLVRMKAADYMAALEPAFASRGLIVRNEAAQVGKVALQELLSEVLSETLVNLLRFVTSERAGRYWTDCLDAQCAMKGLTVDDEDRRAKVAKSLDQLAAAFASEFPTPPADRAAACAIVKRLVWPEGFTRRIPCVSARRLVRKGNRRRHVAS